MEETLASVIDNWIEKECTSKDLGFDEFCRLLNALGYDGDPAAFLTDNPEAIKILIEWIKDKNITHWRDHMAEFLQI